MHIKCIFFSSFFFFFINPKATNKPVPRYMYTHSRACHFRKLFTIQPPTLKYTFRIYIYDWTYKYIYVYMYILYIRIYKPLFWSFSYVYGGRSSRTVEIIRTRTYIFYDCAIDLHNYTLLCRRRCCDFVIRPTRQSPLPVILYILI